MARVWTKCPKCGKNIKNQQRSARIKNLDKHLEQNCANNQGMVHI